ncbi:hypothetical protein VN97_g6388, partial [Penicillium thymicola]
MRTKERPKSRCIRREDEHLSRFSNSYAQTVKSQVYRLDSGMQSKRVLRFKILKL